MPMPDSLSSVQPAGVTSVPLVNPPDKAPGRTDVSYGDESTPHTRAERQQSLREREQQRAETLQRLSASADSAASASAATRPMAVDTCAMPWMVVRATAMNSPVALGRERGDMLLRDVSFRRGIDAPERPLIPGYDSGVMALLLAVVLVIMANFRHYSTFLKTFAQDLWSVRNRGNVFDDRTVSETRIMASLVLLACVCEGILAYCAVSSVAPVALGVFPAICAGVGVAAMYYLWQLVAYVVTGYAFASNSVRRQWVKGFNASQALLGLALVIPAVVAMFNPAVAPVMAVTGAALYVVARIIFICKGFRLFYDNFFSLSYFILYLCALEIAPVFLLCKGQMLLAGAH